MDGDAPREGYGSFAILVGPKWICVVAVESLPDRESFAPSLGRLVIALPIQRIFRY